MKSSSRSSSSLNSKRPFTKNVLKERRELNELVYEGPVSIIGTTVGYQNPAQDGYCIHLSELIGSNSGRVMAKLSMQGDDHLDRESLTAMRSEEHTSELQSPA